MFLSKERDSITDRLESLENEKLELLKKKELIENKINLQSRLAKLSILSQGGCESKDYWVHSGELESICYSEEIEFENYKPTLARLGIFVKGPHQIQTTIIRLHFILDSFKKYNKLILISNIEKSIDFLNLSCKRLQESGSGEINDILQISSDVREISMKETHRISGIGDITQKLNQQLLRRTFNMRGMISSPRPNFIPGGNYFHFHFHSFYIICRNVKIFEGYNFLPFQQFFLKFLKMLKINDKISK